ncbi:MAG: transporter substrate-binding domain-containing protein, partial [Pseudomonadota bacterium]
MKFAYLIEPPFNYVDASGRVTGCDVELAKYVFSEIGIAGFEPVETEFAELLPGVRDGKWRMTTGLFGTDERRKNALFSRPIWALPD